MDRIRFLSALLCLSETFGLDGIWGLLEDVERLGCENPSTSTRTPSTLTLVGERLEDDESSFEAAVFNGPAEHLGALLEGAAEPLDAILWGLAELLEAVLGGSAEPLSVSEEHLADSHGTWASADTVFGFPEEALVPADTDPGPPEERALDSVVLSGCSGKKEEKKKRKRKKKKKKAGGGGGGGKKFKDVLHSTDLDSLLVEAAAA